MFGSLVESGSHKSDFRRRSKFFAAALAFYAVLICAAGIGSIYAYNARIEDRGETELLALIDFRGAAEPEPQPRRAEPRPAAGNRPDAARVRELVVMAPVNRPVATTNAPVLRRGTPVVIDPNANDYVPENPTGPSTGAPVGVENGRGNSTPFVPPPAEEAPVVVRQPAKPPAEPPPARPDRPVPLASSLISSKAISKPVPPYPDFAKRAGAQGTVAVQILIDEHGRVVSAQATSGHPFLQKVAADAALRARFSPTLLGGQPVKVSGVIYYNFKLQ